MYKFTLYVTNVYKYCALCKVDLCLKEVVKF